MLFSVPPNEMSMPVRSPDVLNAGAKGLPQPFAPAIFMKLFCSRPFLSLQIR